MTARDDLISSDYNGMDRAAIDQQILNSDAFKVWVIQKTVHERVVFFNEEHALYEYIHELAYGSPLRTFMWKPNNLGMFPVLARSLSGAQRQAIIIRDLSPCINIFKQVLLTCLLSKTLYWFCPARPPCHLASLPCPPLHFHLPKPPLSDGRPYRGPRGGLQISWNHSTITNDLSSWNG